MTKKIAFVKPFQKENSDESDFYFKKVLKTQVSSPELNPI